MCEPAEQVPNRLPSGLSEVEQGVLELFVDGVRVLGLPRSVGEIYGLLFVSRAPLALDDLVERLGISKGSASQGLRFLRVLGAVSESNGDASRRTYYKPEVNLKRLVGGFIREQVRPHLESGESKLDRVEAAAAATADEDCRSFYLERMDKLRSWVRRGKVVLPLLQRVLGE
jgi:DNA-binding transcriptional regulator GbsR (MarR family)